MKKMTKKIIGLLLDLSKSRKAHEENLLVHWRAANVPDQVKRLMVEASKERIAFDKNIIALVQSGKMNTEMYISKGPERIKMDQEYEAALQAANLSEKVRAELLKVTAMVKQGEIALEAKRRAFKIAFPLGKTLQYTFRLPLLIEMVES
jgi:hypothetical protein